MRGFQDTMRQNPSAGELAIRCRLQSMGIHLQYDMAIVFYPTHFIVKKKDRLTMAEMRDKAIKKVFPDGLFVGGQWLRFEWKGPAHTKSGVLNRDDIKDKLCAEHGIVTHNFPFKPSGEQGISEKRLTEICEQVKEKVTK